MSTKSANIESWPLSCFLSWRRW